MDLFKRIVFAMMAPIIIGGCYAHGTAYDGGYYSSYPPPTPGDEQPRPAPHPRGGLVKCYWGWNDRRDHRGHRKWAHPRPGYVWQRHAWARDGHGWRMHGGYWRRVR